MQNTVPISSDNPYPIREEGLFIPDPTAPDFRGTYTPQAEYVIRPSWPESTTPTQSLSNRLTNSEIERLRQDKKESAAYLQNAFQKK